MSKIRTLVVDDEPWARKRLASLLARQPDFEVVSEAATGAAAIEGIDKLSPDVVFLDIQMPDADGFDVIEAVGPRRMPHVVFVTAYDRYAVRAFDAEAVDYLLKPFDEDRFEQALGRVRRELQRDRGPNERRLEALLQSWESRKGGLTRLLVKAGGRIVFLKVNEVDWFEASGNYVTLHVRREQYLLRETMSALEEKLDPQRFLRIHRSTIVNLDRVKELHPWFKGEQVLALADGTELTVGRAFRDRLRRFIVNAV